VLLVATTCLIYHILRSIVNSQQSTVNSQGIFGLFDSGLFDYGLTSFSAIAFSQSFTEARCRIASTKAL
jgi:hypothetical protein